MMLPRAVIAAVIISGSPLCAAGPEAFVRPVPAGGPANTTLVVYDTLAKPFSLANEVSVVTTLLGRFQTRVDARQAAAVTVPDVARADYIVLIGVAGAPQLTDPVRDALGKSNKPVFALGWASVPRGEVSSVRPQSLADARVAYRGAEWRADLDPFFGARAVTGQSMAVVTSPAPRRALAWREGGNFFFASLPSAGGASLILSDVLLDFYGVENLPSPALVYLVQDFHPGCDAQSFRRLADYFAARGDRFAVSVRLKSPLPSAAAMPEEEFFDALRYAQTRGGRVVLRPEVNATQVRSLLDAGLVPFACELPSAGNRPARVLPGISYGTALGKIEAPGPKGTVQPVTASSVMAGDESTLVIPLNIDPALASTARRGIAAEVEELARLRGTVAGVVVPAWFPFQKMRDAVDDARRAGVPGADLAIAPNWIKTEQAIITGKNVRRGFSLPGGTATERVSFDGNLRRVAQGDSLPQGEAAMATAILLHQER